MGTHRRRQRRQIEPRRINDNKRARVQRDIQRRKKRKEK